MTESNVVTRLELIRMLDANAAVWSAESVAKEAVRSSDVGPRLVLFDWLSISPALIKPSHLELK